jgi:GntR family transcriptional regulator
MSPKIEKTARQPDQIADYYTAKIRNGEMPDGAIFPSFRDIQREWTTQEPDENGRMKDVYPSTGTVAAALRLLKSRGLIDPKRRSYTVVTSQKFASGGSGRAAVYRSTGKIYRPGESAQILSSELVEAPEYVADALDVDAGSRVLRRVRITNDEHGRPSECSVSWMPGEVVEVLPSLTTTERQVGGTIVKIREVGGEHYVLGDGEDQVMCRRATEQEREFLGLAEGEYVLAGRNWWRLADDGTVLEFGEYTCPPERYITFTYRFE